MRANRSGLWPALEVQPAIDESPAETAAEIPSWLQAAAATTDDAFWREIGKLPQVGSAREVSSALGLAIVPVD